MFGIVANIRGFVQGVVRAAVAQLQKPFVFYERLTKAGLGYVKSQFDVDWQIYDEVQGTCDLIRTLDTDQLIPGALHLSARQSLSNTFKYDLSCVFEDVRGNTETHYWSILSDTRLTQNEILELADTFPLEYAPSDFPAHGEVRLEGSWVRSEG